MGLSRRTNTAAAEQLQRLLPGHKVHGVQVQQGLHLKSLVTALDASTLLFADTEGGRALSATLAGHPALAGGSGGSGFQHVLVPDAVCANVLLVDGHVVMQVRPRGGRTATSCAAPAPLCPPVTGRCWRLQANPRCTRSILAPRLLVPQKQ